MRILFTTTRGAGHVGPLVPFARACVRDGHDVVVAAPEGAGRLVRRAGLQFLPVGEPPGRTQAWAPVFAREGSPGAEYVIRELFVGLEARAALPGMLAAVETWRPDLIVRETCEFAACVAAERFGVPLAQIGIHLSARTDASDALLALAAPALEALGVQDVARIGRAPVLTCAPRALDDGDAPARVRRFRSGDIRRSATYELVYVSFGSEAAESHWFPGLYRDVIEALAGLPLPVLVTVGDRRDPAELGPLPRNVRVERWVPQAEVMPRAAAMVGHGGSGSTLLALASGVPVALLGLFVDGPENARRVAAAGAGLALEDAGELREAVGRLLVDRRHRRAAARIADEIAALPPVEEAVGALASMAWHTHEPSFDRAAAS